MCVGEQDTRDASAKFEGKQTMDSLYPGLQFGSGLHTFSPCDPSLLCWEVMGRGGMGGSSSLLSSLLNMRLKKRLYSQ